MSKLLNAVMLSLPTLWLPAAFAGEMGTTSSSSWFIHAELGSYQPDLPSYITVDNGSNFPQPLNLDRYCLSEHHRAMAGLTLGYGWRKDQPWLTQWRLGLRYQHFFHQDVGQSIRQYSLPLFENYDYQWHLLSDVLSLSGRVNLFEKGRFSPYLQAGLGLAVNQTKTYRERALAGVTPRVSPGFSDNISDQFSYHVGAGIDYAFNQQWHFSLGYEFQDLGRMNSNSGIGLWAGDVLNIRHYQTQALIAGISYNLA